MNLFPPQFCFCIAALLIMGGCVGDKRDGVSQSEVGDTLLGSVVFIKKDVEIDLGLIEDDHVFDYLLEGIGEKEIKGVVRSCGCVGPALVAGDKWNFGEQPFQINISLTGKPAGEGVQDFLISFTDDTAVRVDVKYVYLPLPSCSQDILIFKKEETEKIVTLTFRGEKDVVVQTAELPPYISFTQATDIDDSVVVTFVLDRNNLNGEKDGVIKIHTTSKRKTFFTVPFLVLLY
jgi:hypothetical protein